MFKFLYYQELCDTSILFHKSKMVFSGSKKKLYQYSLFCWNTYRFGKNVISKIAIVIVDKSQYLIFKYRFGKIKYK